MSTKIKQFPNCFTYKQCCSTDEVFNCVGKSGERFCFLLLLVVLLTREVVERDEPSQVVVVLADGVASADDEVAHELRQTHRDVASDVVEFQASLQCLRFVEFEVAVRLEDFVVLKLEVHDEDV